MKKVIIAGILLMLAASANAATISDGAYTMKDGSMEMTIRFMSMPDGKLFVDAMGNDGGGKNCRIGDMGSFSGNMLLLGGLCSVPISPTADGFQITATPSCVQCDQGAYIHGTYKRSQ